MKTAYFGWEAAALHNNIVTWSVPVKSPIILRGYEINLSMMPTSSPGLFQGQLAEVLVQAGFGDEGANPDFGAPVLGAGVGGNPIQNGIFATGILKTWVASPPTASAVNDILTNSGLAISVPVNVNFGMLASHLGYPMDFEVQGVLYYDNQ